MTIKRWDIFCRVVDNFGDIGVSWRLARQFAYEHAAHVRLWLDDLASLHALCPRVDVALQSQTVEAVEIHRWREDFVGVSPADVAIEAFGCGLPEAYVRRIVDSAAGTLWITLEYLSAEAWVRGHHGLPSPHPRWPVRRYFFFPGFAPGTGGVLREADLSVRRDAFDAAAKAAFWRTLGFQPPPFGSTVVSLFAYDHAPLPELLAAWAGGDTPVIVAAPQGQVTESLVQYLACETPAGVMSVSRGALEARFMSFLPQPTYDELLWACDINFVRGEDSFMRAQWACRPFVWQVYAQAEGAHLAKLDAFLAAYCAVMTPTAAYAIADFWRAWNGVPVQGAVADLWRAFAACKAGQRRGLEAWCEGVFEVGDLASNLAQFCENKL